MAGLVGSRSMSSYRSADRLTTCFRNLNLIMSDLDFKAGSLDFHIAGDPP